MNENYLAHYGIKRRSGRYPWGSGNRPYQSLAKTDITLKKGTKMSRLSLSKNENVKGVRKFVSIGGKTEKKWEKLFSEGYAEQGYKYLYSNRYKAVKDIKVASEETSVKELYNWLNKSPARFSIVAENVQRNLGSMGLKPTYDFNTDFFRSVVLNQPMNSSYFDHMKEVGYQAIADIYGRSSGAERSIILLTPDEAIKQVRQKTIKI